MEEKLIILNYHIGDRDYRDVIAFYGIPREIRYSDRITFVSDAYVNLLPDYWNCIIVNKKELKKRKKKELRKGLGVNRTILRLDAGSLNYLNHLKLLNLLIPSNSN